MRQTIDPAATKIQKARQSGASSVTDNHRSKALMESRAASRTRPSFESSLEGRVETIADSPRVVEPDDAADRSAGD
jgi:hypothetical protein